MAPPHNIPRKVTHNRHCNDCTTPHSLTRYYHGVLQVSKNVTNLEA